MRLFHNCLVKCPAFICKGLWSVACGDGESGAEVRAALCLGGGGDGGGQRIIWRFSVPPTTVGVARSTPALAATPGSEDDDDVGRTGCVREDGADATSCDVNVGALCVCRAAASPRSRVRFSPWVVICSIRATTHKAYYES